MEKANISYTLLKHGFLTYFDFHNIVKQGCLTYLNFNIFAGQATMLVYSLNTPSQSVMEKS